MLVIFRREGTNIIDKGETLSHKPSSFRPECNNSLATLDKLVYIYNLMPGMLQILMTILRHVS